MATKKGIDQEETVLTVTPDHDGSDNCHAKGWDSQKVKGRNCDCRLIIHDPNHLQTQAVTTSIKGLWSYEVKFASQNKNVNQW